MNVSIVGSHGLYAKYGGWDQLVINLSELRDNSIRYKIFNPKETEVVDYLDGVEVEQIPLSGSGFQGMVFDSLALIKSFRMDVVLMLGIKAIPVAFLVKILNPKIKLVVNIGGIEWERPQFNIFLKIYLKLCLKLTMIISNRIIIDNKHYKKLFKSKYEDKLSIIAYGGTIDTKINQKDALRKSRIYFKEFYLSVSRSIEDNKIDELCKTFEEIENKNLVLISNLSFSIYGKSILKKYKDVKNIKLIDGLYDKGHLDAVRRSCKAYIHSHTLCGSAPSLIEMIVCRTPIFSIDVPQNRFTLENQAIFFKTFNDLKSKIIDNDLPNRPSNILIDKYKWSNVVKSYESCFKN